MNETIKETDWINIELQNIDENKTFEGERLPALKLEPNKLTEVEIETKEAFQKWNTTNSKGQPVTKALIKVIHNKEQKIWWLNVKNPVYRDIMLALNKGTTKFKILQTGIQADTKYVLVN